MINVEKIKVECWETALRGMRNPMNSWDKSDSIFWETGNLIKLGEADLELMQKLSKAGNDHAKFLRMITVSMDITAPLYWWKEFDTYKVGTVRNSCSTMHKIHAKEFTMDDFSWDQLLNTGLDLFSREQYDGFTLKTNIQPLQFMTDYIIPVLNVCREKFIETKDKKYWWQMIQLLPASYNQKSTVTLNYQVLKSMCFARRNHKLDEWKGFCEVIRKLPYFKEICVNMGD